MTDTILGAIIGAGIALLSSLSTAVLIHLLSLREDKIKRQRDAEEERARKVRESLRNVSTDSLRDATKIAGVATRRPGFRPDKTEEPHE